MTIKTKTKTYFSTHQLDKPKMYFLYILNYNNIPWDFCMKMMVDIFHKDVEEASAITDEILSNGECLCGVYIFEIAESKANIVEELAKKEKFSMQCLLEEV